MSYKNILSVILLSSFLFFITDNNLIFCSSQLHSFGIYLLQLRTLSAIYVALKILISKANICIEFCDNKRVNNDCVVWLSCNAYKRYRRLSIPFYSDGMRFYPIVSGSSYGRCQQKRNTSQVASAPCLSLSPLLFL